MDNENDIQTPNQPPFAAAPGSALTARPGQPLCRHYTGASQANLTGDYSCQCLAGVPYERWCSDMRRWPCQRRHLLGLEQHGCEHAAYGSDLSDDVDEQVTEMTVRALSASPNGIELSDAHRRGQTTDHGTSMNACGRSLE